MKRAHHLAPLAASVALALASDPAREAQAAPERAVFALVVGNNRSVELGRPELRYADDDSAKYYEVFRMLAPEESVHLLTELDPDSARLFPDAQKKAHSPTRESLKAAAAQIARAAGEAMRGGAQVDFYFTFAGHGDVDQGKGFLELRDGRFTADDVEAMLKSIPSTRSHVILDSCNSFFVLNARKPGGQRLTVTAEAAKSLSDRLPNVGVFLSTSAEAEVFEWSELQSGIFSHAVRSGLLGGADANGDGDVSYDELRGFIEVASQKVKNPLYRPHVFAQGPRGEGNTPLFPVQRASGARLELDEKSHIRLTVRDENALPWIDVHKEQGAKATLRIPTAWAARATVEEREVNEYGSRLLHRYSLDETKEIEKPIRLAALTPTERPAEPRGPDEMLRMLFAAPFGPRALAAYALSAPKESDEVYGVSREDAQRMDSILLESAEFSRGQRISGGWMAVTIGGAAIAGGVGFLATDLRNDPYWPTFLVSGAILGAASIGGGIYNLLVLSEEEELYRGFATSFATTSAADLPYLVSRTEAHLFDLAAKARRQRMIGAGVNAGISLVSLGAVAAFQLAPSLRIMAFPMTMSFGYLGALTALSSVSQLLYLTPSERFVRVWEKDSSRLRLPPPTFSAAPIQMGNKVAGGIFTVSGAF